MSNNSRPVYQKPVYDIIIPVRDLSLNKDVPQFAAAIDAQIEIATMRATTSSKKTAFKHPFTRRCSTFAQLKTQPVDCLEESLDVVCRDFRFRQNVVRLFKGHVAAQLP